jgi:hypothetical protein
MLRDVNVPRLGGRGELRRRDRRRGERRGEERGEEGGGEERRGEEEGREERGEERGEEEGREGWEGTREERMSSLSLTLDVHFHLMQI